MNANQTKLAHELILVTIAFLRLVNKRKEKAYACHLIIRAVSEMVKRWLTGYNWTYF